MILPFIISLIFSTADPTLKNDIEWKRQIITNMGFSVLSNTKYIHNEEWVIERVLNKSWKVFKRVEPEYVSCVLWPAEIRIVKPNNINDPNYFDMSLGRVCARYFMGHRIIYITPEAITTYTEDLAHEFFHYFYDQCGVKFNIEKEHEKIKQYEEIYMRQK